MVDCRACKSSIASLVDGRPLLMCLRWRRAAKEPCPEFEREPGADQLGTYINVELVVDGNS